MNIWRMYVDAWDFMENSIIKSIDVINDLTTKIKNNIIWNQCKRKYHND